MTSKSKKLADTMASECIAVRIRILNRAVSKIYDDALRPFGVKVSQLNILVATAKMGTAKPADVCGALHLSVSTLSRNVERMKNRGWIDVLADATDGRAQPFCLGKAGEELLATCMPAWRKAQKETKKLLGDDVVDLLSTAKESVRRSTQPG